MPDEIARKNWFQSLPGMLTTLAGTLAGLGALIAAISPLWQTAPVAKHTRTQNCAPGYVWRGATPEDHVCVSIDEHLRTVQDNQLAGSRRDQHGGPYGADTCAVGFVWRDAFSGDRVCVLVDTRTQVARENAEAALHAGH